jgi:hypothetical protein
MKTISRKEILLYLSFATDDVNIELLKKFLDEYRPIQNIDKSWCLPGIPISDSCLKK